MKPNLTVALALLVTVAGVTLLACARQSPPPAPSPVVAQDMNAARSRGPTSEIDTSTSYFRPDPAISTTSEPPAKAPQPPAAPPLPGRVSIGHSFALANCRPCHVVESGRNAQIRFANAPAFHTIAVNPHSTDLSLNIWLRNPHPTMPTLVLTRQEARDVIAYIMSLRDAR